MAISLEALRTGRTLPPRNIIFLLLVIISVTRPSKPQGLVRPEGLGKLKKIVHLIWSRTHDYPGYSIVL
jgi:hypothetical protein